MNDNRYRPVPRDWEKDPIWRNIQRAWKMLGGWSADDEKAYQEHIERIRKSRRKYKEKQRSSQERSQ